MLPLAMPCGPCLDTPGSTAINATHLDGFTASTILTVVLPPPTLTGFTPSSGKVRTSVTITGTNFASVSAVRFNGVPASGLAASIFGVALSLSCDPTSCRIHPFEPYGVVLSAIGLFVFLVGLTLAAAFPPEGTGVS
jgi:hypothetical protein